MGRREQPIYRLEGIEVDAARGCIRRDGQPQHLRHKTLQVLLYLIEQRQRPVTKEELLMAIWSEVVVSDNALEQCLAEIRRRLGDDRHRPRFVKTIPKVGYHFIGRVEEVCASPASFKSTEITTVEIEYEEESASPLQPAETIRQARPAAARLQAYPRRWILIPTAAIVLAAAALTITLWPAKRSTVEVTLPQVAGKKSLAVMYFDNSSASRDLDWLRQGLADMLITDLSRSPGLTVLGRQQIQLLLERIGHRQAQTIRLDEALEIGRRSQAEAIALGSFAKFGEKLYINIYLYDVRSSQPLAAESLVADRPDDLLNRIDLLSLKLAAHLGAPADEPASRRSLASVMTDNLDAYRNYSLALEKAEAYHTAEALALWQKATRLDPQFAMAYARIGYTCTLIRVNEAEKGKRYLEHAFRLSQHLTEKDRLYIHAWYTLANGDTESGIGLLREIIARYPQEVEAYLRLGYQLSYTERLEEAITVFNQGLLIDPEAKEIYNALGFAYSGLGRYNEALAAHQHYVQLAPTEPNAHDSLGLTYIEAGRYAEAQVEFEQAFLLNPNFHFARLHLGDVDFLLGRYQLAIDQYRRFLALAPSDWDAAVGHHRLALLYLKKGNLQQAEAAARQEISSKNDLGGSLLIALARGELQSAKRSAEQLFGKSGDHCPPQLSRKWMHFLRGRYALMCGHTTEALEQFKEALRHPPQIWNVDGVEGCLADAYLDLGRIDEAIDEYERLIRINPNWPPAHCHIAQAYERKGEHERAHREYERFREMWTGADSDIPELIAAKR